MEAKKTMFIPQTTLINIPLTESTETIIEKGLETPYELRVRTKIYDNKGFYVGTLTAICIEGTAEQLCQIAKDILAKLPEEQLPEQPTADGEVAQDFQTNEEARKNEPVKDEYVTVMDPPIIFGEKGAA
jgi:hypothetical protein